MFGFLKKKKKKKKIGLAAGDITVKELKSSYNKKSNVSRHQQSADFGDADSTFTEALFDNDSSDGDD